MSRAAAPDRTGPRGGRGSRSIRDERLVAVRTMPSPKSPQPEATTLLIPNRRDEIERAQDRLLEALGRAGYDESARFAVRLAVEEALSNAFNHGHRDLPASVPVKLEWTVRPGEVRLLVEDQGPGFKPELVPDPTLDENLEIPTGRGLLLMRAYMFSVEYAGRGNSVRMVYRAPSAQS
jgi:serine/threonine-protein kinase RsbW